MPRATTLLAAAAMTLAGTAGAWATAPSSQAASTKPTITIGAEGFSEDVLVADMYQDVLNHAGYPTSVKDFTGGRPVAIGAIKAHQLDLVPDYAGSLLVYLNPKDTAQATQISTDVPALRSALAADGATALNPSTALDTNVFVVTKATASKYGLSTLSSLKASAPKLVLGAPAECTKYYYCLPGLKAVYGLRFKSFLATDEAGPIAVSDLKSGRVQVVELFSSTGTLIQNPSFVALTDNKHLEPADYIIPVIAKSVDTSPVAKALNAVSAKLTTDQLETLNIDVDNHQATTTVAQNWLIKEGLL